MYERFRPVAIMSVAMFRADPKRAVAALLLQFGTSVAWPAFATLLGVLVDAVAEGSSLVVPTVGMALAVAAWVTFDNVSFHVIQELRDRTSHLVDRDILELISGLAGIEHTERPDHLDKVDLVVREQWLLGMSVQALIANAGLLAQFVLSFVVLISIDGAFAFLPVFAVPALVAGARAERIRIVALEARAETQRRANDLFHLVTDRRTAAELRVFGLGSELKARQEEAWAVVVKDERDHRWRGTRVILLGRLTFIAAFGAGLMVVLGEALEGRVSVGQVAIAATLAGQLLTQLAMASGGAAWLAWTLTAVRRYTWLIDYAAENRERLETIEDPAPVPDRLVEGIRLEGVTFRYPETTKEVLSGVDLFLPAGSTVAVVGENGAGKTSLVKLLSRFYEPSEGRILVDGIELRRFELAEWRARTSAGFQDHARLELLARESVGVADRVMIGDGEAVLGGLRRAGTEDILDALPEGLESQLGPNLGGTDLSGGQWAKVAMGRAMLREAPLLLCLDEPTAALDAEAEHRLFERWAAAARATAQTTGAVTILVSHRFSTVRMADLIVVVDSGAIVELGSHAELVAAQGLYAELYELQARAYR